MITLKNYDVIVIGAGASGCLAALSSARNNKKVLIIEHLDRIGKKILSTGNGKCNYTNRAQGTNYYRGMDPAFVVPVFKQFGFQETIDYFRELGIYPKEKNGYFYPYSEQASSMVEVLEIALHNNKVDVELQCEIADINLGKSYKVRTSKGDFTCKSLIFATGLRAGRKTGCDGSAFQYIEKLGHHFIDVVPALVQMKSKDSFLKNLAGIRAEIRLKMLIDDVKVFEDEGELLHIDGGLSGIVSFQGSRYASYGCKKGQKVEAIIDYYPGGSFKELYDEIETRFYAQSKEKNALEAMIGFFPYKLVLAWYKEMGIDGKEEAAKINNKRLKGLCHQIKETKVTIDGTKNYEDAQVCAGGVDTREIDASTMESRIHKGLYFCGELVDIDGMCGGYNLQWAWSSGYVAGIHAGE